MRQLWQEYAAAWSMPDRAARQKVLEARLTPDVQYVDPAISTSGYTEISDYMEHFQVGNPGRRFVIADVLSHHSYCLAYWTMQNEDNDVEMRGASFADLAPDGRLQRIRGFFKLPSE